MTPQELELREQRAVTEPLVISETGEGFRVYAPTGRSRPYLVTGTAHAPSCTCPDFQKHKEDPNWRCKHIVAVWRRLEAQDEEARAADGYEAQERAAIANEGGEPPRPPADSANGSAQMLIKRSVSPDGRIDALSVEFSCPVEKVSANEVKSRAQAILRLQRQVVEQFLNGKGNRSRPAPAPQEPSDASVPARLLSIGGTDGRYGRRLFITVDAEGRRLRLYGNRKHLADQILSTGFPRLADRIEEGAQLNVPCRVVTKLSEDGRFLNIEKVLPASGKTR